MRHWGQGRLKLIVRQGSADIDKGFLPKRWAVEFEAVAQAAALHRTGGARWSTNAAAGCLHSRRARLRCHRNQHGIDGMRCTRADGQVPSNEGGGAAGTHKADLAGALAGPCCPGADMHPEAQAVALRERSSGEAACDAVILR